MPAPLLTELADALQSIVGPGRVLTEPASQQRFLRDFSWYSPILSEAFAETHIDAVVQPSTVDELVEIVGVAVRQRVPITVRGAGTGNYGQSIPLYGGVLVDTRRLNRISLLDEQAIEVEGGAV